MKGRVTISDVARRAGVSTGTVSAVLNERDSVRPDTRRRVIQAIRALDYRPSSSARHLASANGPTPQSGRAICLIIKEVDNPFYSPIILGVQEVVAEAGYHLYVANSYGDYSKEGELVRSFHSHSIAGAIITPVMHEEGDLTHLFMLRQMNFPFVLLERAPGLNVSTVSIDNAKAMQTAVSHLIDLGHKRIVHISGPPHTYHTGERIHGVQKAFSISPLVYNDDYIVEGGTSLSDGYRAAMRIFAESDPAAHPTGVTCFNDLIALGVLRALSELGLRVADDVSVVGCDDIESASFLSKPLTTVRAPRSEIGRRAAGLLLEEIEGTAPVRPVHVVLESDLVVRETSGPLVAGPVTLVAS